jgi:hypothetical protein
MFEVPNAEDFAFSAKVSTNGWYLKVGIAIATTDLHMSAPFKKVPGFFVHLGNVDPAGPLQKLSSIADD